MRDSRGFTLMEMMVAIGIFAVIAAISYGTLDQTTNIAQRLERLFSRSADLQLMMAQLERDIIGMVNRPVRDGLGEPEGAFLLTPALSAAEGEIFRFTTTALNVTGDDDRQLVRVAWRILDHTLYRVTWQVLDRDQDSPERRRPLLDHVEEMRVQLIEFDSTGSRKTTTEWSDKKNLPQALDITLVVRGTPYHRLFQIVNVKANTTTTPKQS